MNDHVELFLTLQCGIPIAILVSERIKTANFRHHLPLPKWISCCVGHQQGTGQRERTPLRERPSNSKATNLCLYVGQRFYACNLSLVA